MISKHLIYETNAWTNHYITGPSDRATLIIDFLTLQVIKIRFLYNNFLVFLIQIIRNVFLFKDSDYFPVKYDINCRYPTFPLLFH